MNKFVIVAPKRTGKTTLVNKLLACTSKKVCGYQTSKLLEKTNEDGLCPLYIYPVGKKIIEDDEHCVGIVGRGRHDANNDVFNTTAVKLITASSDDELIIMDEVGFVEANAEVFKQKVFEVLKSKNPVLIMLKNKENVEFLEDIKKASGIELIEMNISNRDEVFERIKNELS